jgi:hypothetical protein
MFIGFSVLIVCKPSLAMTSVVFKHLQDPYSNPPSWLALCYCIHGIQQRSAISWAESDYLVRGLMGIDNG